MVDVTKPILSVSHLCENGVETHLSKQPFWRFGGGHEPLIRRGGVYFVKAQTVNAVEAVTHEQSVKSRVQPRDAQQWCVQPGDAQKVVRTTRRCTTVVRTTGACTKSTRTRRRFTKSIRASRRFAKSMRAERFSELMRTTRRFNEIMCASGKLTKIHAICRVATMLRKEFPVSRCSREASC